MRGALGIRHDTAIVPELDPMLAALLLVPLLR
jgi:hypothetical protein